jgi:hypothetical protein
MKKYLPVLLGLALTTSTLHADLIDLSTDFPAGTPLVMNAGGTSGPMTINIVNNSNPPQDFMAAFQIALTIVPAGGAAGALTFHTPAAGSGGAVPPAFTIPSGSSGEPPNYIFAGNNTQFGGIQGTNTGSGLTANDIADNPVHVPTSGSNLLAVTFAASPDASGLFGVFALRGNLNTAWTDSNAGTQFFVNVPDGTGQVEIGEVRVIGATAAVPEPYSMILVALAVSVLLVYRRAGGVNPL